MIAVWHGQHVLPLPNSLNKSKFLNVPDGRLTSFHSSNISPNFAWKFFHYRSKLALTKSGFNGSHGPHDTTRPFPPFPVGCS